MKSFQRNYIWSFFFISSDGVQSQWETLWVLPISIIFYGLNDQANTNILISTHNNRETPSNLHWPRYKISQNQTLDRLAHPNTSQQTNRPAHTYHTNHFYNNPKNPQSAQPHHKYNPKHIHIPQKTSQKNSNPQIPPEPLIPQLYIIMPMIFLLAIKTFDLYNLSLFMTDFLVVGGPDSEIQGPGDRVLEDIEGMLSRNCVQWTRVGAGELVCLIGFELLRPEDWMGPFYDYQLVITISYNRSILSVKSAICDSRAIPLKACSLSQRTLLLKYTLALNQSNSDFQVKVHPRTGEIELQCVFCVSGFEGVGQEVYRCLNNFRNKSEIIYGIIQVLEVETGWGNPNGVFDRLLEKIQPVRSLIVGSNQSEARYEESQEQNLHKKVFFVEETTKISTSQALNTNMLDKMRKTYVEEPLSQFIHNNTKVKLYNFMYVALDSTPDLKRLLKSIQAKEFLDHNEQRTEAFSCDGREMRIDYKSQRPESINYQYSVVDKLSKKKNYFTFMKQYIIARNYLQITNHYLLTKASQGQTQTLLQYFQKNKTVLSLESKMKLVSQLLSIGCLCLERMENFTPSLSLSNILVDQGMNFKLNSIAKSEMNPRIELLQAMYWLLLRKRYFFFRQGEMKVNRYNSLQDESLKFIGPSVIIKILLKSLQNYERDIESPKSIQNLLLITNRVIQAYDKVLNGRENGLQV